MGRRSSSFALAGVLLAYPLTVGAQREPVLRQIKVPHSYYYREMYLPQATSGPSAVTWSPDGRELIYSMQGSLWRQRLGSREARQLTSGPGYDYQPDWSADGRRVVYASYQRDAIELRLLDLDSGDSRILVANGAVNVEPRWSPDGRRIAFVSSAYQGRWHLFMATLSPAVELQQVERLTVDRDSGLPRYYYGVYNQYLSPAWSPDGDELIFVGNHGRIWGSGGFWRMAARAGAEARELYYEETTWKARPDWSPDGKRVVYSSYLGRQWHQLWLMTANGGDPFQLTYGEGDATGARWSPDGRRIAYVSNERGNTALCIVEVPGGAIERIRVERRIYRDRVARVRLTVIDGSTGRPTPARVSITMPDGRNFAPDNAWRHADDGFDRGQRSFEYGYFHTSGTSVITVPPGLVALEVSRGPEYRVHRGYVVLAADSTASVRVVLDRLADLPSTGWYSADLHVHMNYGGAYRNDPATLAFQAQAEDVHLVENLIVNKEGRIPDIGYFRGRPDPVSTTGTLIVHDQEYHTSVWGHIGLLGLTRNVILPGYAGYTNTAAASLDPTNAEVLGSAREQGGVTGYVHPFDSYPDPSDTTRPLTHELPVDVALGRVDYYEALGFVDDYSATAKVWYQLLNCGFKLPAGAGTDAMANFASLRGPVGMNRVFARSGRLEHRRWLDALKAGRTFATNGPLLAFTLNGREIGDSLALPAREQELVAQVHLTSYVPVDHLEIVNNGAVVAAIPLTGDRTRLATTVRIPVRQSGWYLLRARANGPIYPVLDVYPYATTSPIYVTVGGEPIRSAVDADYFLAWIDRLERVALDHKDWNTGLEKESALKSIRDARTEFNRRRAP
ncbi:MAG TPA: CehA/McbA family metallohydrolase [Gemmatimonadales bacterium]